MKLNHATIDATATGWRVIITDHAGNITRIESGYETFDAAHDDSYYVRQRAAGQATLPGVSTTTTVTQQSRLF